MRKNCTEGAGAQNPRGLLHLAVYGLDGKPDRPHHQGKGHDPCRQGRPGPAKGEDDPQPVQGLTERAAVAEENQQGEPGGHGRQDQRQVSEGVQQ